MGSLRRKKNMANFETAILKKDYATARKESKKAFFDNSERARTTRIKGLEQWQRNALWNYYSGNVENCVASIPKPTRKKQDTD